MPMKVYINGDTVEIDKSGDPLLNIPRNKAIYRIENDDVTIFNNEDRTIFRTDKVTNIRNQANVSVGNLQDVVKYLSKSVVVRGTSITKTTTTGGGGGEDNTASNVGTGAGQVFKQKTGVDLELKTIKAGTNITVTNNADDITIDASGGGGEVNTASNLGSGQGVFAQKTGVDLEFKSLVAGDNITFTSASTELSIKGEAGHEPYDTNQMCWPHQVLCDTLGSFNYNFLITPNTINAVPLIFQQDVDLNAVGIQNVLTTLSSNTGHVGIYELISKSASAGIDYYRFDLVQRFTPTFSFNVTGQQEITLSPAFTMLAGKVYAIVLLCQAGGANQSINGRYQVPYNRFLGRFNRIIKCTTGQAFNPLVNTTPTTMPSPLYFYPESGASLAVEPLFIRIQNA